MKRCCWCRTPVQAKPGSPYCEAMGYLFVDNPWQCARGDSPRGGANQQMKMHVPKFTTPTPKPAKPQTNTRKPTTGELL